MDTGASSYFIYSVSIYEEVTGAARLYRAASGKPQGYASSLD